MLLLVRCDLLFFKVNLLKPYVRHTHGIGLFIYAIFDILTEYCRASGPGDG